MWVELARRNGVRLEWTWIGRARLGCTHFGSALWRGLHTDGRDGRLGLHRLRLRGWLFALPDAGPAGLRGDGDGLLFHMLRVHALERRDLVEQIVFRCLLATREEPGEEA